MRARLHPVFQVKNFKNLLYNFSSACCPNNYLRRWCWWIRSSSRLCCVHQVVTWTTMEIFALHNSLQRWRHSTFLAPVERSTPNYGVRRISTDAPMAHVFPDSDVHRLHARSSSPHSWVPSIASIREPRPRGGWPHGWPHQCVKRGKVRMWQVLSCNGTLHAIVHILVTNLVRAFPSKRRTMRLRRHRNAAKVLFLNLLGIK
jgi:hypothetical protein